MNSESTQNNFANNNDIQYAAHIITLVSGSVSYEKNVGQFVMKYATPNAPDKAFNKTLPKQSTRNVINGKSIGKMSKITTSNYISIKVPKHLFYITEIKNENDEIKVKRMIYKKGQQFIALNAGGSVDEPLIVGVL